MFSGFHKIPPQNSYFSNKYEFYFTLFFHSVNSKLTFLERKVSQRTSHRIYHFILVKFLRFQGTFYKKSFGQGLGQKPQLIMLKKTRQCRVFLIAIICWNCCSKPPFLTFLIRKVSQRIFLKHTTSFQRKIQRHPFYPRRNKKATFVIL